MRGKGNMKTKGNFIFYIRKKLSIPISVRIGNWLAL